MTINANGPAPVSVKFRWWEESDGTVAGALSSAAQNIAKYSWHRRMLNLVCLRYITGREMIGSYAYSIVRRPASVSKRITSMEWVPPTDNVIATCGDVYAARIWKQRPFIVVTPIAGNFEAYVKSIQMGRFIDAVFHDTTFWDTHERVGEDATATGDGFVKVHASPDKKKICITRVLGDEILINEEEALYGRARSVIQACFGHREELIAQYGTTKELRDAIWHAPSAYPGLYNGEMNAQDVVPYYEGWHLKGFNSKTDKEEEGTRIVAVNNVLIGRDKWERDHFPFAQLKFSHLPTGYFGQGLVEKLLPYQAELNRYDAADWENQQRISWPRVLNPIGSQVTPGQLTGLSGGMVNYIPVSGHKPEFIFPEATNPSAEARRQRIKNSAFLRARIAESSAKSEKPDGLNSGTAIMAWASIDDSAHVDVGQRDETFVTQVGELVIELAEEIEPKVLLPGRTVQEIDWKTAKLSKDSYHARAFPMSNLPQLPAARQQRIDNWYANGQINKQIKMRLEQVPDVDGYEDLVNAPLSDIHMVLDAIVEHGTYMPPEPFEDLPTAIQIAQSRWLHERTRKGTPQDRLDLLAQWMMQCDELIAEGAQPTGIQAPQGAPAAPPMQVAPSQGQAQLPANA